MFALNADRVVYLHRDAIDFRKNINGLASLVDHGLGLNAFAQAVFVFGNRRKDRIKILGWDRNGFWLLQKRLENARFIWLVDVNYLDRSATTILAGGGGEWQLAYEAMINALAS